MMIKIKKLQSSVYYILVTRMVMTYVDINTTAYNVAAKSLTGRL